MTLVRNFEFQGEEMSMSDNYTLDGEESINAGWQDTETVSIAKWEEKGKSLVIRSKVEGGPGDGISETWVYDKQ